jgi:hypothetical protein
MLKILLKRWLGVYEIEVELKYHKKVEECNWLAGIYNDLDAEFKRVKEVQDRKICELLEAGQALIDFRKGNKIVPEESSLLDNLEKALQC